MTNHFHPGPKVYYCTYYCIAWMQETIHVRCSPGFKADVESFAAKRDMSMSEYLREAARQQMQKDIGEHDNE